MPFDLGSLDWVTLGIGLAILAVGWVIIRSVLRLTMKVFTAGCTGLIVLALIGAALVYFR
jgi:hypothetical protein